MTRMKCIFAILMGLSVNAPLNAYPDPQLCELILKGIEQPRLKKKLYRTILQKSLSVPGLNDLRAHLGEFRAAEMVREPYFKEELFGLFNEEDDVQILLRLFYLLDIAKLKGRDGRSNMKAMEAQFEVRLIREFASQIAPGALGFIQDTPASEVASPDRIYRYELIYKSLLADAFSEWPLPHRALAKLEPKMELAGIKVTAVLKTINPTIKHGVTGLVALYSKIDTYFDRGLLEHDWKNLFLPPQEAFRSFAGYAASLKEEKSDLLTNVWLRAGQESLLHIVWKTKLASTSEDPDIKQYAADWLRDFFSLESKRNRSMAAGIPDAVMQSLRTFVAEFGPPIFQTNPEPVE